MNISDIRAILQFGEEKVVVLFPKNLNGKEFITKCMQEFNLDPI